MTRHDALAQLVPCITYAQPRATPYMFNMFKSKRVLAPPQPLWRQNTLKVWYVVYSVAQTQQLLLVLVGHSQQHIQAVASAVAKCRALPCNYQYSN